ncbi:MAG: hypoxanthine phosphoribosyltransferase [candidate division WOR-3 bacterium]|nr:MAG: hypoxanthine phosphoribosyltransferase [candidate division WOR-3 bacterium]
MDDPNRLPVRELISEDRIQARVTELARQVSADHAGKELLAVGILKGSWVFLADLVRQLTVPVVIDFMTVSSYGETTETSGVVKIVTDLKCPIEKRHVLVVDDILDTGLTMKYLLGSLRLRGPESLKVCVLLDKPARRKVDIKPDYVGFEVPDRFVVGYGVDFAERYRHLPYIGFVEESDGSDK